MSRASLLLLLSLQAAAPSLLSPPTSSIDPAAATFTSDAGVLVVSVKPDKTADYEEAVRALQDALSKATEEKHREIARSWRVFKAADLDAKANAVYIHLLEPAVKTVDYRLSVLLDELLGGASAEVLAKYRDAIAAPPSKLGLTELANMSVAPAPKNASPAAPKNVTPPAPKPPPPA